MKGNERNKPCSCGSGKKQKVCLCWQIDLAHEEAIYENKWRDRPRGRGRFELAHAVALAEMVNYPFRR